MEFDGDAAEGGTKNPAVDDKGCEGWWKGIEGVG